MTHKPFTWLSSLLQKFLSTSIDIIPESSGSFQLVYYIRGVQKMRYKLLRIKRDRSQSIQKRRKGLRERIWNRYKGNEPGGIGDRLQERGGEIQNPLHNNFMPIYICEDTDSRNLFIAIVRQYSYNIQTHIIG